MTNEILQMIISGVVGIGGLVVAFFTVLWSQKNKVEPFKKQLYEKQIAAADECLQALVQLQTDINKNYIELGYPEYIHGDDQLKQFISNTQISREKLKEALLRWSAFLPDETFHPMVRYLAFVEYVSGLRLAVNVRMGSTYHSESPWDECASYFVGAVKALKDILGIKPLRKEISKTIGFDDKIDEIGKQELWSLNYLLSDDYRSNVSFDEGFILARRQMESFGFTRQDDDRKEINNPFK